MRKAIIPIDDDADVCNTGYIVDYKLTSDMAWTRLMPDPAESPIEINGLEDDLSYDVRIYRKCCDGQTSLASEDTFTSTP